MSGVAKAKAVTRSRDYAAAGAAFVQILVAHATLKVACQAERWQSVPIWSTQVALGLYTKPQVPYAPQVAVHGNPYRKYPSPVNVAFNTAQWLPLDCRHQTRDSLLAPAL